MERVDRRFLATDRHLKPQRAVGWLADAVLIVHLLFVAFVVGGVAFIWIGAMCGWRVVRNFPFRVLHLAAILFVFAEALIVLTFVLFPPIRQVQTKNRSR